MQFGSYLAVFVVVWWLCFVAVLPIGNRSQAEAGEITAGTDPAAPVLPRIWLRAGIATLLAIASTALLLWALTTPVLMAYWNR